MWPQGAPLAIIAAHNTLQSRVDDLARHIERVEAAAKLQAQEARAAQRDRVTMLVLGGLGGILLTVGALAVWVWIMGNG